jgi:hypothetical protein
MSIESTVEIRPERQITWEQWQAGRAKRRYLGNLVAPRVIRRESSSSDARLRAAFDGERGPPFGKAFDPAEGSEAQPPLTQQTKS